MRTLGLLLPIILLSLCISILQADTIHVPADQPTIQAGINMAVNGDTVLVADGTYTGDGNRDIDFMGKVIVLISENSPEVTIIDCENGGRGFYFHNGEGHSSIVQGFAIRNGNVGGGQGGGMFCYSSSPSILQCYFLNNDAEIGGGISCDEGAMPIIEECVFTENYGIPYGGGIHCDHGSNPTISRCEFYLNEAWAGGGIRCGVSSPMISECVIVGNTGIYEGGGIECRLNSSPTIMNCIISSNNGAGKGGGLEILDSCSPIINRCLINNNIAVYGAGIMSEDGTEPIFSNCTISGNQASSGQGGGITIRSGGSASITNSIFWDNEPGEIELLDGSLSITYSDIEGSWEGEGNIDEDPLFVGGAPFDYHLTEDSPCIDAGDPKSPPDPDSTRADMGAYYFDQSFPPEVLSLSVEPDTTYYHRGDMLGFTVIVTNNTDSTLFFQGWTEGETPWGIILSPLLGPINVVLGPYQTISPHISQQIPGNTPYGGPYIYRVMAGEYPDSIYAEDSFEFFVVPPGKEQPYEKWKVVEGANWQDYRGNSHR